MQIPETLKNKIGRNLHKNVLSPIYHIKEKVVSLLNWKVNEDLNNIVTSKQCFDDLLIPKDHPSRRSTDTYYLDENRESLLRTHMTAHLCDLIKTEKEILYVGDVYRKDTIDKTHNNVFTQMDGFKLLNDKSSPIEDMKATLNNLLSNLFPNCEIIWEEDYFPFTINSLQASVRYNDQLIEILGGGQIHPDILKREGFDTNRVSGWAFGMGLDRLAMIFCKIPDIRLLWSEDERFTNQFKDGLAEFIPYSKYPKVTKDISMWVEEEEDIVLLEVSEICNSITDLIEEAFIADRFELKSLDITKKSIMIRLYFRSNDRTLTNEEINIIYFDIRNKLSKKYNLR